MLAVDTAKPVDGGRVSYLAQAETALIRPFAALLGAVGYQRFLDNIEPDEYPYHADDPRNCLLAAAG